MRSSFKSSLPADIGFYFPVNDIHSVDRTPRGLLFATGSEFIAVDCIAPDVIRISLDHNGVFAQHPTYAVINDDYGVIPFETRIQKRCVVLETPFMKIEVTLSPFSMQVCRSDGTPLVVPAGNGGLLRLNDLWAVNRFRGRGDRFFGLGQKTGPSNRDGRSYIMKNEDIILESGIPDAFDTRYDPYYLSIPLVYHMPKTGGGAVSASFFDSGHPMRFDMSGEETWSVAGGGRYTEYLFAGPTIASILSRYSAMTGRMPAPPLWALGHHQCRWYDYREKDIRALADAYREKKIPCDSLWLDIDYMDDFRIFTWDSEKYPDPESLIRDLAHDGFRTVTIIDPGVKRDEGYSVYDDGSRNGHFCSTGGGAEFVGKVWPGHTVFPDFVRKETRRWWRELIARHIKTGLGGIWIDMNEPAVGIVDDREMRFDGGNDDHDRWHNQYGLLMAQATCEGIRDACPGERTFVLSRSGFAGIQRYAANWMGDNASRWEHLAMSIPMCSAMGISGQPFVGCDIGGFAEDTDPELLVRWYQLAAFQPFCRNHSIKDCIDQYPWSFGNDVENLIRAALSQRYSLLPYLYTAFMMSAETGEPVQRPLLYDFQDDRRAWNIDDQFMCGRHLMIAPVVKQGAVRRRVYLPHGWWYSLNSDVLYKGGKRYIVDAPLGTCPVFVKAGAVIPMIRPINSTMEYTAQEIYLDAYEPVGDGCVESVLHEDDGRTDAWLEGKYRRTTITFSRSGDHLTLSGTTSGAGFGGAERQEIRINVHGNSGITEKAVVSDGGFSLEW